jgi:S-adenosylmethionine-diacylglycerol 3-amino-3-carboxypropyl transferase
MSEAPNQKMQSEISGRASFELIRYAQCWEDADILLEGLNIQPGDTCVSIASAGENSLSMLTKNPGRVIALDLSMAQLHCLALRVAAFKNLTHPELLELIGSSPSTRRLELYVRCRKSLSPEARAFWDARPQLVRNGIGDAGKFERYFRIFRSFIAPLIASQTTLEWLFALPDRDERERVFAQHFDTWRWRLLIGAFFSKTVLGWLGRDPSFFKYTSGSPGDQIKRRARHALVELEPGKNPYLEWILWGEHRRSQPHALRAENFEAIRENLYKLEWHQDSLESHLDKLGPNSVNRFNLSDIFEYMSPENSDALFERLAKAGRNDGRLAYWNLLAERHRPDRLAHVLQPLEAESKRLFDQDKAFFYGAFVLEKIVADTSVTT